MTRRRKVSSGVSQTRVLGTIRATIDDAVRTWDVVSGQSQSRPYASGVWLDVEPGRRVLAVGAFDTATLASLDTTFAIESGTVIVTSASVTDGLASAQGTCGGTFSRTTGEGSVSSPTAPSRCPVFLTPGR